MSDCLTLAADGNPDALLEHVPDGVLDRCIAQRKSARCGTHTLLKSILSLAAELHFNLESLQGQDARPAHD